MKKKIVLFATISSLILLTFSAYTKLNTDKAEFQTIEKQHKESKVEIDTDNKKATKSSQELPAANDDPVNTQFIIRDVVEHPDFQYLPMSSLELKSYGFSTEGFTPYNWVITGYFTDSPNDGLIINYNLHSNSDDGGQQHYYYKLPNVGKVTLTGISEDRTKLFFKTSSGKTGEFDVTSSKGSYKILK